MTEQASDLFLKKTPKRNFYASFGTIVRWGVLISILMTSLGIWVSSVVVEERAEALMLETQNRVEIQAKGKSDIIATWVNGLLHVGDHITGSDLIRLFASEVNMASNNKNVEVEESLMAQLPYMQQAIAEYVSKNRLQKAFIVSRSGKIFLSSESIPKLSAFEEDAIVTVIASGQARIMPLVTQHGKIYAKTVKPIFSLGSEDDKISVVSVMVSVFPVYDELAEMMSVGSLALEGERVHLMQQSGSRIEKILLDGGKASKWSVNPDFVQTTLSGRLPSDFKSMESPVDNREVFLATSPVINGPFLTVFESNAKMAMKPLMAYSHKVYAITGLIIVLFTAIFIIIVSYMISARNRHRVSIQEQVMRALVKSIEIRDPYISGHHDHLADTSLKVAVKLGMGIPERSTLFYASFLSGVGKIFIPHEIMSKAGKLTIKERKTMQEHVSYAMDVVSDIDFEFPVATAIGQMHERLDGSGYPNKLKGGEVNILSRILGASDAFCAMTRPRAYRKAKTAKQAIDIMRKEKGKYDENILNILTELANNAEIGRVANANPQLKKK